jgi:hypothetical protein
MVSASAHQAAVVVVDLASAAVDIAEIGPDPAPVTRLALSVKRITAAFDIAAGLHVASTGDVAVVIAISVAVAIVIIVAITIMIVVAVSATAAQLAIDVNDPGAAAIGIVEASPNPAAVASLTACANHIPLEIDRRTRLNE